MSSLAEMLSRDFEETKVEATNKNIPTKAKGLRISLLVFASMVLMVNNLLYVLYVPTVLITYEVLSKDTLLYYYGMLYASKDIAVVILSPLTGALIDRVNFDDPLISGVGVMMLSLIIFAFGDSYWLFFSNRIFQGVSSALTDISIMVITATLFTEDDARTKAFGMMLGCASLWFLLSSPFVTIVTTHLMENRIFFLIFIVISFVVGLILYVLMKKLKAEQRNGFETIKPVLVPLWRLAIDPYILICAGALMMSQSVLAFLQYVLPFWLGGYVALVSGMRMTWFLALFSHISGIIFALLIAKKYPHERWLIAAGGLTLEGCCSLILPFVSSYVLLIIPTCGIAFGVALVRIIILSTLPHLMDTRHTPVYGSVYALCYMFYAVIDIIAPIILYNVIPYTSLTILFVGVALSNIFYAPILFYLKRI